MKTMTSRLVALGGLLGCIMSAPSLAAQAPTSPPAGRGVLVTPLLRAGALSDTLARLVRLELSGQYHVPLVAGGDVSSALQRTDSAGLAWTFESVRALAASHHADALVDVAAIRMADGVQVMVATGRAPFQVIDNTRIVSQASLEQIARDVARQVTRRGWPASEY